MALRDAGNYNNSDSSNRVFDQSFYSRIRIKNKDKLAISFTYSKGLLKVEILEEKEGYKYDTITGINLSPTKAKLLINELERFITKMKSGEVLDPKNAVGVNAGVKETVSFIGFRVTGNRQDVPEHSCVIGKVNEKGNVEDVVEFVFNVDYDYSLNWSDIDNMEVSKSIDQFMGIQTFLDVLKEFAYTSAGALGATVWDTGRYEVNRIIKNFNPIYEKMGIDNPRSNSRRTSSDNFFDRQNNSTNTSSTSRSFDELEDLLN